MTIEQDDPVYGPLRRLIDAWCDRRELGVLAGILPAYTSNFGLTEGWGALMDALRILRTNPRLTAAEKDEVERLVPLVEHILYRK
jgi:hypothetical protein